MTLLAGIALHIDFVFDEIDREQTQRYLADIVSSQAGLLFKQQVDVNVSLSDGSLRALILVSGSIYAAICAYGSFRSGIDYLINDAKLLKEFTKSALIKNGLYESDIIDIYRIKTAAPDKIRRVLLSVERLENKKSDLTPVEYQKERDKILTAVSNIIDSLSDEDARLLITRLDDIYIPRNHRILHRDKTPNLLCREEDIHSLAPLVSANKRKDGE